MMSLDNQDIAPNIRDRFKAISKNKNTTESNAQFLGRNVAQHGARAAEVVAGLPGNIKNQFQKEIGDLYNFFSIGSPDENESKPKEGSLHELIMNPPGSPQLREHVTPIVAEKLFGDKKFLEPRSKKEEAAGELTQDIISFFFPGSGGKLAVKLGAPILGNLAKEGVKFFGGSDETAQKAKLGVMLTTTLAGQANAAKFASNQIDSAKKIIPQDATANVANLPSRLEPLMTKLNRGFKVPSKARAREGIMELDSQIQNNRMSLHSLMDARDNINEWISEAGGWDVPGPTRTATVKNLNDLKRAVIDTIDENLQQRFPQAAEMYKTGYEAAAVVHRTNVISNFIEKHYGRKTASMGAKLVFPALAGGAAIIPKTAVVSAGLYPLYKSGQVLARIAKSPTLAKYYQDVITHSVSKNVPAMVHSMEKLDHALEKEEKKAGKINPESLEEFKKKFKKKG